MENVSPLIVALIAVVSLVIGALATYGYYRKKIRANHTELRELRSKIKGQTEHIDALEGHISDQSQQREALDIELAAAQQKSRRTEGQADSLRVTVESHQSRIRELESLLAEKNELERAAIENLRQAQRSTLRQSTEVERTSEEPVPEKEEESAIITESR